MKILLIAILGLVASTQAISVQDRQLLDRFLEDPAIPKTTADIWCLVRLAAQLRETGRNDFSAIQAWADDVLQTGVQIASTWYTCYQLKPSEEATWIEEIRYNACVAAWGIYVEYERNRLTQSARKLAEEDYWVQLVVGLVRCGVVPLPRGSGKVQPTSEFYGEKVHRLMNTFNQFV